MRAVERRGTTLVISGIIRRTQRRMKESTMTSSPMKKSVRTELIC